MKTIKDFLQVNNTCFLVNFGSVIMMFIGLWNSVTAVGECSMLTSSLRNNLQNMAIPTRQLWTKANVRTPFRCAEQCKNDDACVSFFYNRDSLSCVGHSITLGITDGSMSAVGNKYYVGEVGEGYIGDVCTTSSDCYVTDSECRKGACWCAAGYSFWPSSRSCVQYCTTYGNDFTEVLGNGIYENDEETILNVTFESCTQSCVSATRYTCVTFDYGWKNSKCFPQSVTKFDKPTDWYEDKLDTGYAHYQRDCL
ncbi:uncharacterized protein LOC110457507 [Mizuhopecten yessoensis]|uniref:uncharacterized protein LOC110457507 n=1 Tax=Mizuhopecten yessoensis TaxID=6573 RepID=UPI000B45AD6F|nr:uncharacterized protein LOC110457507 [Mizuhopecten yessoensis]